MGEVACCPFVQWQDSGLWSHESWFESKRGNREWFVDQVSTPP